MKKLVVLIFFFVSLFGIFLYFYFRKVDYSVEYIVDNFTVIEAYNKDDEYYKVVISNDDYNYVYYFNEEYTNKRNLINSITINNYCIMPNSDYFKTYEMCFKDDYYFSLNNNSESTSLSYEKIDIYNLDNLTFMIWNYKGFYLIGNDLSKTLNLYSNDIYNPSLIVQFSDALIVPNFDSTSYTFNKYNIVYTNGKTKEWQIGRDIYFDSYVTGINKNKFYLVDKKEELYYELDYKKQKIEKTSAKLLINDNWEKTTITKLINNESYFEYEIFYNYIIKNDKLYFYTVDDNNLILVENDIKEIVKISNERVYYLKDNYLYSFDPYNKETLLLSSFEWNFNYKNIIYIFD